MNPVETTRTVIDAFLRGDIETLLSHVADDVDWEYGSVVDVPWYLPRRGHAGARAFFAALAEVEFLKFEPKAWLGEGDLVLLVLDSDYRIRRNGRRVVYEDAIMVFRYDAAGRIARFAHRIDLHQAWAACHDR